MPRWALDHTHLIIIRRLGRRMRDGEPWGVTAPDVADLFDLDPKTAWRNLERFVREGWLEKTSRTRHRPDLVERLCRPANIYVATRKHLEEPWKSLRIPLSAPRRTV